MQLNSNFDYTNLFNQKSGRTKLSGNQKKYLIKVESRVNFTVMIKLNFPIERKNRNDIQYY